MTRKRTLVALAFLLTVLAVCWQLDWWPRGDDPTVVRSDRSHETWRVENGSVFDRASVELGGVRKVVLPADAVVQRTPEGGTLGLSMQKTLAYGGHPPLHTRLTLRGVRRGMGCAVREEGGTVVVATFGEWHTWEGGAYLRLIAAVPAGVELEQREGLSGPDSVGHDPRAQPPWQSRGHWGPGAPAAGWRTVPSEPDRDRAAEGLPAPRRPDRLGGTAKS